MGNSLNITAFEDTKKISHYESDPNESTTKSSVMTIYDVETDQEISFFEGIDGNIYMQNDFETVLAISYTESELPNEIQSRAPKEFIIKRSGKLYGITITANVIGAGQTAVEAAITQFLIAKAQDKFSLKDTAIDAIVIFAKEVVKSTKVGSYESDIIHSLYVYNGCSWLLYDEFELPTGDTIGNHTWLDNPILGVAPAVCKTASLKYPY